MLWLLLVICTFSFANCQTLPPSCDSPVFCYGDLLHTVQLAKLYNDSKTFVDMRMIHPQNETLENFVKFNESTGGNPTKQQVQQFVNENFEKGNQVDNWTPTDYNPTPNFISEISNNTVRKFTQDLIEIWPTLARRVKPEVHQNEEQYSLIPVPNGFIVPGGRFQESYYFDSYWIVDGLLISEMNETARGIIDNFISFVERFGFVPNAGRVYYLKRSQPPLLTPMAHLYYQQTKNTTWLRKNIDSLQKELNYWSNQSLTIQKGMSTHTLYHYNAVSAGPRPESYSEDVETAAYFTNESQRQETYIDLKSGAESCWDFSARWIFDDQGGNAANLSHIQTRRVVPVDLNSFLCGAYKHISELYSALGEIVESTHWEIKHLELKKAIHEVLWDEQDGIWYDYDTKLSKPRRLFYPTNLSPLWAKCFDDTKGKELGKSALKYLQNRGALDYLGGLPASQDDTGEQWDFPNAWAPLQDIVVKGLHNSGYKEAQDVAEVLAKRWVNSNALGFQKTGTMFEKYDAVVPGQYGGGGEYEVQPGFGMTNGVALRFIYDYYRK